MRLQEIGNDWDGTLPMDEQQAIEDRSLPLSANYFPLSRGRYEVKPGLLPLGVDLGNGVADQKVFQIDDQFREYRNAKLQSRAERLSKYYQTQQLTPEVMRAVVELMGDRLRQEYPEYFALQQSLTGQTLHNRLTGERLCFDAHYQLQGVEGSEIVPAYADSLDALALQMQEDWAVICRTGETNWLSALHICFPNYWSVAEKIGQEFAGVHAPVAGMEPINRRSGAIVHTLITQKPMVRFAWGLSTDSRLNHHPEPPTGIETENWQGRQFDPLHPQLYLRIERQVIWGLPQVDAALFTIRTYFRDCQEIRQQPELRSQLGQAIASMEPEALQYKGLAKSQSAILDWLHQDSTKPS